MLRASNDGSSVELNRIVTAEELRPLMARILVSRHFASAGRRKKFLTVVADYYLSGRAEQLSEFCLAAEAFDFDQHYDPAANASVRVCAHDVRKRLKDYFDHEGASEKLVLQIPPGGYKPVFLERESVSPHTPPVEIVPAAPAVTRRRVPPLAATVGLLLGGAILFGLGWWSNRDGAAVGIWKPLLEGPGAVLVVMSNPPLFQFLWASDPVRSRQNLIPLGPETLAAIDKQLGPSSARMPYLVFSPEDYTGMGEAMGLMNLTRFFQKAGREMLVKQSKTTGTEDLKNHHVVLVGGPLSNQWLPQSESLDFDLGGNFVLNRKPLAGEQREYHLAVDPISGQPATDWALITVSPGIAPGRAVMMLAGIRSEGTQAAAEFVTDPRYLEQLQRRLGPNSPRFFQALLRVEVKKWQPAAISLVAVHPIAGR